MRLPLSTSLPCSEMVTWTPCGMSKATWYQPSWATSGWTRWSATLTMRLPPMGTTALLILVKSSWQMRGCTTCRQSTRPTALPDGCSTSFFGLWRRFGVGCAGRMLMSLLRWEGLGMLGWSQSSSLLDMPQWHKTTWWRLAIQQLFWRRLALSALRLNSQRR